MRPEKNDSDLQAQIDEVKAYQALLVPALFQEWAPWVGAAYPAAVKSA